MAKYTANGYLYTKIVAGTSYTGLFDATGATNIIVVPGTSHTGLYNACGALNVVPASGTSHVGVYHACGALNVVFGSEVGKLYHSTGAIQVSELSGADVLLAGYSDGIALDFTDASIRIKDTVTPANDYNSIGRVSGGALIGPAAKITYTSPSNKFVRKSTGHFAFAPHNLVLQSEDTSDASWTAFNCSKSGTDTVIPNATSSAHAIYQAITASSGAIYEIEFEAKAAGYNYAAGSWQGGAEIIQMFDLSAGTVATAYGAGTVLSSSITDVGDGWYRCTFTGVAGSASMYLNLFPAASDANPRTGWSGDTVSGVSFRKMRVSRYPSSGEYIQTTTAAKYGLPYVWDINGVQEGLLVEESRTNLINYSNLLSSWTSLEATGSGKTQTGIDGLTSACTITDNSNSNRHIIYQNAVATTTTKYCQYAIMKQGTNKYAQLLLADSISRYGVLFDLNAGTVVDTATTGTPTGTSNGIIDYGNGWYLCWITKIADDTSLTSHIAMSDSATPSYFVGSPTYAGTGTTIIVGHAQTEAGAFPTSPIRTDGAAKTRMAEDLELAGSKFHLGTTDGTLLGHATTYNASSTLSGGDANTIVVLGDNTNNERLQLRRFTNLAQNYVTSAVYGGLQTTVAPVAWTSGQTKLWGASWTTNDFVHAVDGVLQAADTSFNQPVVTELVIGRGAFAATGGWWNGVIKKIWYVPEQVSDTELTDKTTP